MNSDISNTSSKPLSPRLRPYLPPGPSVNASSNASANAGAGGSAGRGGGSGGRGSAASNRTVRPLMHIGATFSRATPASIDATVDPTSFSPRPAASADDLSDSEDSKILPGSVKFASVMGAADAVAIVSAPHMTLPQLPLPPGATTAPEGENSSNALNSAKPRAQKTSAAEVPFSSFTFDRAIEHLQAVSADHSSTESDFLACVPRHRRDRRARVNFYDLYFIDKPSTMSWTQKSFETSLSSKKEQSSVMQMSLLGILLDKEYTEMEGNHHIPLSVFIKERAMVDQVLKKPFFRFFKESKVFYAWKYYVRRSVYDRRRRVLIRNSVLGDAPLVKLLSEMRQISCSIQEDVDLFEYLGSGLINAASYFRQQEKTICKQFAIMKAKILQIGALIQSRSEFVMQDEYLGGKISDIIEHHPYTRNNPQGIDKEGKPIDWDSLRSIQRLKLEYKNRIERIFYCGEFMVKSAIAHVLRSFWIRSSQGIDGVPLVNRSEGRYAVGSWSLGDDVDQVAAASALATGKSDKDPDMNRLVTQMPQWERKGRHLCVSAAFYIDNEPMDSINHFYSKQPNVRVVVTPIVGEIMHYIHIIYTALGGLLYHLPNLKQHPLIWQREKKIDTLMIGDEDEEAKMVIPKGPWDEELSHPTAESEETIVVACRTGQDPQLSSSNGLFSYIQNNEALIHAGLQQIAVRLMHKYRAAFQEGSSIDAISKELVDILQMMKRLDPESALKQLERSTLLPLIRYISNGADKPAPSELAGVQTVEQSRMANAVESITYFNKLEEVLARYANIKHPQGVVCTLSAAIKQLDRIRERILAQIVTSIPVCFMARCRLFTETLIFFESRFNIEKIVYHEESRALMEIQNFDYSSPLFDSECEICEKIYNLFTSMDANNSKGSEGRQNSSSGPPKDFLQASLTPGSLYEYYMEKKRRVTENIVACRVELAMSLKRVKKETSDRVVSLHQEVEKLTKALENPEAPVRRAAKLRMLEGKGSVGSSDNMSPELVNAVCDVLEQLGNQVNEKHGEVKRIREVQELLVDAHNIVGNVSPYMTADQIDPFDDMNNMEKAFQMKNLLWLSVRDAYAFIDEINSSPLGSCDIPTLYEKIESLKATFDLLRRSMETDDAVKTLQKLIEELAPRMEYLVFILSDHLRVNHWRTIQNKFFIPRQLQLTITGNGLNNVSVADMTIKLSRYQHLRGLPYSFLLDKGFLTDLPALKEISASATIEQMIEKTLDAADSCVRNTKLVMSDDWLSGPRLRDKLPFELFRLVNCDEIAVRLYYCLRSIQVAEYASIDMNIRFFDERIFSMKSHITSMINFIEEFKVIQLNWISLFYFVKFLPQGDLDRETNRLYFLASEEMKRIETEMRQGFGTASIFDAYSRIALTDANTTALSFQLSNVNEDIHNNLQSKLDVCPRLSLLSYQRVRNLVRCWIMGAGKNLSFISRCFREMFEGVGSLRFVDLTVQRRQVCRGILSNDRCEIIDFKTPIYLDLPLEDFINEFDEQLRKTQEKSCDMKMMSRVQRLKILLSEVFPERVVLCMKEILSIRLSMVNPNASESVAQLSNFSAVLTNLAIFAEDLSLCLGLVSGAVLVAKPDLEQHSQSLSNMWRQSLNVLMSSCLDSLSYYQNELSSNQLAQKYKLLYSSLIYIETVNLQTIRDLLQCNCRESAVQLWYNRYKLKFVYDHEDRIRSSPFDVHVGCMSVAFGMEYPGGSVQIHLGSHIEGAIQKTIGSVFAFKGTVFVSYEDDSIENAAVGEFSVNSRDVAHALGRICNALGSIENVNSVKLFLARLLYLDAVGCVDFTTLDEAGMQILVNALGQMWTAIEHKDDFFLIGSLKYPLKTNAMRSIQNRKTSSMSTFMHGLNGKTGMYTGLFLIGMASETVYTSSSLFNYFTDSVFNSVAVTFNSPCDDIAVSLSSVGFVCSVILKEVFLKILVVLKAKYYSQVVELRNIISTRSIQRLIKNAGDRVSAEKSSRCLIYKVKTLSGFLLLQFESEMLFHSLWKLICDITPIRHDSEVASNMRMDVVEVFRSHINPMLSEKDRFVLDHALQEVQNTLPEAAEKTIKEVAAQLEYIVDHEFLRSCYSLWKAICGKQGNFSILFGAAASGKTAVRDTVIRSIRKFRGFEFLNATNAYNSSALVAWKASMMLGRAVRRWRQRRQMYAATQAFLLGKEKEKSLAQPSIAQSISSGSSNNDEVEAPPSPSVGAPTPVPAEEVKRQTAHAVHTTFIHHASLSTRHLIGTFDGSGKWSDGILTRCIRSTDIKLMDENTSNYSQFYVVVLDGPFGAQIEQLFSASRYASAKVLSSDADNTSIALPSGESGVLPPELTILIETSDVSQASPHILLHTSMIQINCDPSHMYVRIIKSWFNQMYASLSSYPVWTDVSKELESLLMSSTYVTDLLKFDISANSRQVQAFDASKVSCFLKYLEELLIECHSIVLEQSPDATRRQASKNAHLNDLLDRKKESVRAPMAIPNKQGSVSTSPEASDALGADAGIDIRLRELMLKRYRCIVIYASTWAFGGPYNGTEKMKLFDAVAKQRFVDEFGFDFEYLKNKESLFLLNLDLNEGNFINALDERRVKFPIPEQLRQFKVSTGAALKGKSENPLAPVDLEIKSSSVDVNQLDTNARDDSMLFDSLLQSKKSDSVHIRFHTPGSCALETASSMLFKSGARVLLVGDSGSGKTTLISSMLQRFGKRCPNPRTMKRDISQRLFEMLGGGRIPEGIPAVLDLLSTLMRNLSSQSAATKAAARENSSISMWRSMRKMLHKISYNLHIRDYCNSETIFGTAISLRHCSTADALREQIFRELRTENENVLESPMFTRGVIFIDDFHLSSHSNQSSTEEDSRIIENRVAALIKGLLQSNYTISQRDESAMQSSARLRSSFPSGRRSSRNPSASSQSSADDSKVRFVPQRGSYQQPILHKNILSDPRLHFHDQDDLFVNDFGIITAATGKIVDLLNEPDIEQLAHYFSILSAPSMDVDEIHSCFVQGSVVSLMGCPLESNISGPEEITFCVKKLASASFNIWNMLSQFTRTDDSISPLQMSIKRMLDLHFVSIKRICDTLYLAKDLITSTGALLQLWLHEWKRTFIDLFPPGASRNCAIEAIRVQLDKIDASRWGVSTYWLQSSIKDVSISTSSVWVDVGKMFHTSNSVAEKSRYYLKYTPVGMQLESKVDPDTSNDSAEAECVDINIGALTTAPLSTAFYPAAVAFVLRITRLLSTLECNAVVSGFIGSQRSPILHLAASMSGFHSESFEVVSTSSSAFGATSHSNEGASTAFTTFLKKCVLRAGGYEMSESGVLTLSSSSEVNVLMIISSAQLLSIYDRVKLLGVMNEDYAGLFNDREIESLSRIMHDNRKNEDGTDADALGGSRNQAFSSSSYDAGALPESLDLEGGPGSPDPDAQDDVVVKKSAYAAYVPSKGSPVKRAGYGSSHSAPRIQGYIYNWVKKGLQRRIGQNLKIILSIDVPRASPAVSALSDTASKKKGREPNPANDSKLNLGLQSKARFSLLRGSKALTSVTRSERNRGGFNAQTAHEKPSSVQSSDVSAELPIFSVTYEKNDEGRSLSDAFFDCPILGAMIKRKFANIWWDISNFQAVQGVCDNLLKPHNLSQKTSWFTLASRNILLNKTVLQEGVMNMLMGKEASASTESDSPTVAKTALTSSWRVVVRGDNTFNAIRVARRLSSVQFLGIFSSFSRGDEMQCLLIRLKDVIETAPAAAAVADEKTITAKEVLEKSMIETMIDEARNLLPHLLSLKCSSDSVLLNKSIVTMEPDHFAEAACRVVVQIIEDGGAMLMKRRDECIAIDSLHKHSMFVLDSLNSIIEHLKASVEEIQKFLRIASAHLVVLTKQLSSIRPDIQKTSLYEQYQICLNDESSIEVNIQRFEEDIVHAKSTARANLTAVSLRDWNTLGTMFSDPKSPFYASAPPDLIDSFKGVLLLTETKSKRKVFGVDEEASRKTAGKKSDDKKGGNNYYVLNISNSEALYRGAEQMSSSDVVSKLLLRHGDNISLDQYMELRALNECMTNREEVRPSTGTPEVEFINHLTSRLRNFLFQIERTCAATMAINKLRMRLSVKAKERELLLSAVEQVIRKRTDELLDEKTQVENYISGLDAEVSSNRTKVARLANIDSIKKVLEVAIEAHRTFIDSERKQIDTIMRNLVADSCIAAAVLVRTGWLPEQMRQEAMDEFRRNLKSHIADIKMSDDPFVLGCMLDRAQVNRWTLPTSPRDSLPRDPASINSLSLVFLNPLFTYVVDPEGSAPAALRSAFSSNYEILETSAINFTIAALQDIVHATKGSMKPIAIMVTDTQAGVSKDLVNFLSSELDCIDIESLPGSTIIDTGAAKKKRRPSVSSEFRPMMKVISCLRANVKNDSYVASSKARTEGEAYAEEQEEIIDLIFNGNLKVVVVSTMGPTIDRDGVCTPFPAACFRNMLTVHWTCSQQASYFVDPRPFHSAMCKSFAPDYTLETALILAICEKISPNHVNDLKIAGDRVIDWSLKTENLEGALTALILKWFSSKPEDTSVPPIYADERFGALTKTYVTIGYLVSEQICQQILQTDTKRRDHIVMCLKAKEAHRDALCYHTAIGEACALTSDFVRIASVVLHPLLLPPFALTSSALSAKAVAAAFVHQSRVFVKMPVNLFEMHILNERIMRFQKFFRNHKKRPNILKLIAELKAQQEAMEAGVAAENADGDVTNNEKIDANAVDVAAEAGKAISAKELQDPDKFLYLSKRQRQAAVNALHVVLAPIRNALLKSVIAYVYDEIKPGYEWLVKLSLLLSTWAQSSQSIPSDELRALLHFYSKLFFDVKTPIFAYLSSTVTSEIESDASENPRDERYRVDAKRVVGSQLVISGLQSVQTSTSRPVSVIELLSDEAVDPSSPGAARVAAHGPLPNVLSIADRVTGYVSTNRPASRRIEMLRNNLQTFVKHMSFAIGTTSSRKKRESVLDILANVSLRGPGKIEGLTIHRRSTRWRVKGSTYSAHMTSKNHIEPALRWFYLFTDDFSAQVTEKNELFRAKIIAGNAFEIDWLGAQRPRSTTVVLPGLDNRSTASLGGARDSRESTLIGDGDERRTARATRKTKNSMVSRVSDFGRMSVYKNSTGNTVRRISNQARQSRVRSVTNTNRKNSSMRRPNEEGRSSPDSPINNNITSSLRNSITRRSLRKKSVINSGPLLNRRTGSSSANVTPTTPAEASSNSSNPAGAVKETRGSSRSPQLPTPRLSGLIGGRRLLKSSADSQAKAEALSFLFESEDVRQEFKILERHPSLQGIFKGISEGIKLFPEQFKEWKLFMRSLNSIDFTSLTKLELAKLASQVVPPQLQNDDSGANNNNEGSWYSGRELSIVQTMLLAAVLAPESSRSIVELMLSLTENYLSLGGIVIRHEDELSSDEDDDEEEDDFDDTIVMKPGAGRRSVFVNNHGAINEGNGEDDDDAAPESSGPVSIRPALSSFPNRGSSSAMVLNPSQMARMNINLGGNDDDEDDDDFEDEGEDEEDEGGGNEQLDDDYEEGDEDDDYDDDDDDGTSTRGRHGSRFRGSFSDSRSSVASSSSMGARGSTLSQYQTVKKPGLEMLNYWGYLKQVANGSALPSFVRYPKHSSRSTNNCRLFENWEAVLKEVLGETIIQTGSIARSRTVSEDRIGSRSRASSEDRSYFVPEPTLIIKPESKGPVQFKDMLKTDKYRLFMNQRNSTVPFKPYTPIFLGRSNQDYQMSFLSHISRELTLHKAYNMPSGPRLVVINGSLLGKTDRVSYALVSANKAVDRHASGIQNWHYASQQASIMEVFSELCGVINEGVRSTAYLKTAGVKARGGTVYVLEMLNLHDPAFNMMFSQSIASDDAASAIAGATSDQIVARRPSSIEGQANSAARPRRGSRLMPRDSVSEATRVGGRLSPVPMSVVWDQSATSYGPVRALSNFAFHWLPSATVPEIISGGDNMELRIVDAPSSVIEGAIWEEVEMNYITTSNTIKRLLKISRDASFKDKLRTLSSFDIRVASGVVSIWRFLLYIRSRSLEVDGKPGAWSVCLAPLSSSQVAHLTLRVAEVLKDAWQSIVSMMKARGEQNNERAIIRASRIEITAHDLLMNSYFSRCVWLCVENLCHMAHTSPNQTTTGVDASSSKSPDRSVRSSVLAKAAAAANADPNGSSGSPTQSKPGTGSGGGMRRGRMAVIQSPGRTSAAIPGAALLSSPSAPASAAVNTTATAFSPSSAGGSSKQTQPVPPSVEKPSNVAKRTSFLSNPSNNSSTTTAAVALNASKGISKRGVHAAKAKVHYPSFKEITDPALLATFVYRDSFGGEEFKNRLLATVGRYLAEVVANKHTRPSSAEVAMSSAGGGSSPMLVSRKSPMDKVNQVERDAPVTGWPDLSVLPCDLTMGPIESERLIEFLRDWSLS